MKNTILKISLFVFVLLLVALPMITLANSDFGLNNAAEIGLGDEPVDNIVTNIIRVALGFLGLLAVVIILYAGYVWMTAGGDVDRISKARKLLINATIGLVIILSAYSIASFIINSLSDATGANVGNNGNGGGTGGGGFGAPTAFIVASYYPNNGASNMPRNVLPRINFNKKISAASVSVSDIQLQNADSGQAIPFSFEVINKSIKLTPLLACDNTAVTYCFDSNSNIRIIVNNNSIESVFGDTLSCVNNSCTGIFSVGDYLDLESPDIAIISPEPWTNFNPGASVNVLAQASDDSRVVEVRFFADGVLIEPILQSEAWQVTWSTSGIEAGKTVTLEATAEDLVGNVSTSAQVKVKIIPAHCFNEKQDADLGETGLDCGGECGGCLGDSCDANPSIDICQPDAGSCAQGVCDAISCICQEAPIITNVSPDNGAVNNYITIAGKGFGNTVGVVTFLGTTASGDEKIAALADCAVAWTDTQLIIEVPSGAVTGGIKVATTGGDFDTTLDDLGWAGEFTVNDIVRPGICNINPATGPALTQVALAGQQFTNTQENNDVYVGGVRAAVNNWTNSQIDSIVPNLQSGNMSVFVQVDEQRSNPVTYQVAADQNTPRISYIEPGNGPIGQYVTIYGSGFGYDESQILVYFTDGQNIVNADIDFPDMCGNWSIQNDQILVKVPNVLSRGFGLGDWRIIVSRLTRESNPVNFTINNNSLIPGLCLLDPNNGPAGTAVNIYGEGFGAQSAQVRFYNNKNASVTSWSNEQIGSSVPNSATTGPVVAINSENISSNSLNFSVAQCTVDSCLPGLECCGDGVCRQQCDNPLGADEYVWEFRTGAALPPFAVQQIWPQCEAACLNAAIGIQFSNPLYINSLTNENILVVPCVNGECNWNELNYNNAAALQRHGDIGVGYYDDANYIVNLDLVNNLAADTYYRVIVKTGASGVVNIEDSYLTNINFSTTGTDLDSYSWIFKSGNQICALESVELMPDSKEITTPSEVVNITAYPRGIPDICDPKGQRLQAYDFDWQWSEQSIEPATARIVRILTKDVDNDGKTDPQVAVQAVDYHDPDYSDGQASIEGAATGTNGQKQGTSLIDVNLGIPKIDDFFPKNGLINSSTKTLVTIKGSNFGNTQGDGYVLVNNTRAKIADCNGSWSDEQIVIEMPLDTLLPDQITAEDRNLISVIRGKVGDTTDEGFTVNDLLRPALCSITPNYGAEGSRVLIDGYNFGDSQQWQKNNSPVNSSVLFYNNINVGSIISWSNTRIIADVPAGSSTGDVHVIVPYNNNLDDNKSNPYKFSLEPYIDFITPDNGPVGTYISIYGGNFGHTKGNNYVTIGNRLVDYTTCSNFWSDRLIIVKVPDDMAVGDYDIQVVVDLNLGEANPKSNTKQFEVNTNPLGPQLCSLSPDCQVPGSNVTISGDNFGNNVGASFPVFTNNVQTDVSALNQRSMVTTISEAVVPGQVTVYKDVKIGERCAGFHIAGWCPGGEYEDIMVRTSSNSLPFCMNQNPRVVEKQQCEITVQSPAPYKDSTNVCLQAKVSATFDQLMKVNTIKSNSVIISQCNIGDTFDATTCVPMSISNNDFSFFNPISNQTAFKLLFAGDMAANTWYQVQLTEDILATNNKALIPYNWHFRTGNDDCSIEEVLIAPAEATINVGQVLQTNADAIGQNCSILDSGEFTWVWQSDDITKADFVTISQTGKADVQALAMTLADPVIISATTAGISGQATLTIDDPNENKLYVIENQSCEGGRIASPTPYKDSTNVCINTIMAAIFNKDIDAATLNNSNIIVQEMVDEPIFVDGDIEFITSPNSGHFNGFKFIPADNLNINSEYKITLTTGILSEGGISMDSNYQWSFTTDDSLCEISSVKVVPSPSTVFLDDTINYTSIPYGPQCLSINPNSFDWQWTSSNINRANLALVNGDFSDGVISQATINDWDIVTGNWSYVSDESSQYITSSTADSILEQTVNGLQRGGIYSIKADIFKTAGAAAKIQVLRFGTEPVEQRILTEMTTDQFDSWQTISASFIVNNNSLDQIANKSVYVRLINQQGISLFDNIDIVWGAVYKPYNSVYQGLSIGNLDIRSRATNPVSNISKSGISPLSVVTGQCGNQQKEIAEDCDSDANGNYIFGDINQCSQLDGYMSGLLKCSNTCSFDTSDCNLGNKATNICLNAALFVDLPIEVAPNSLLIDQVNGQYNFVAEKIGETNTAIALADPAYYLETRQKTIGEDMVNYSRLYIYPANVLEQNAEYQVIVFGGANGVKDLTGQPMSGDYILPFTTGDDSCLIDSVEITPYINNQEVTELPVRLNQIVQQTQLIIRAFDANNNEIIGLPSWRLVGPNIVSVKDVDGNTISDLNNYHDNILQVSSSGTAQGQVSVIGQIDADFYGAGQDTELIDVYMCNLPWFYKDDIRNFELRYCRGNPKNIIINGSFEIDRDGNDLPDGWTALRGNWKQSDATDINNYLGQHSIYTDTSAITEVARSPRITTRVEGLVIGAKYTLSVYAKQVNAGSDTMIMIANSNSENTNGISFVENGAEWRRMNISFTANASYSDIYILVANMAVGGRVYFDGLQLELGNVATEYQESIALPLLTVKQGAIQDNELVNVLFLQTAGGIADGIGLKVYKNFTHYSPYVWYNVNTSNPGNPSLLDIGSYSGLQEGRTVYVNMANKVGADIYTNILLLSHTQDINSQTQNIFNQLLANWRFNTNMDSVDDQAKLARDTKRFEDLQSIKLLLDNYSQINGSYPALSSGTYQVGKTVSAWDSWQNNLATELGIGLPVDPLNRHINCPAGYDSVTCWNPIDSVYQCPDGSHVYTYQSTPNNYSIYSNFELPYVKWNGGGVIPSVYIGQDDSCQQVELHNSLITGDVEQQNYWTSWINRDTPGGDGDFENLSNALSFGLLPQSCATPLGVECLPWPTSEVINAGYQCTTNGLICINASQPDGSCNDYQVRWFCPGILF